jgi:hypothetical protein
MKPKGYLFFHLNLAFSSIEEDAWADVIQTCYHPLLDLIEKTGIPIGIELTGWTLKQIERIDITWIERFKMLLNSNSCELIGSGYCQIIGPLVPHKVNEWNQKIGLQEYIRILGVRPQIALVNEMAYSNSLVELYEQFGYKGFIMDRDNIKLALGAVKNIPTHAKGVGDTVLPVLWSDSILFQKVQHYAHGDIAITDYLNYINQRIGDGDVLLPIYCNDAEVFDYRPGRFSEERPTHSEGEWKRVENLLNSLSVDIGIEWISPTQALALNDKNTSCRKTLQLTSITHPIPVKKQAKYNIARWSVTGRDDTWLNTMCHRITEYLIKTNNDQSNDWQKVCELWASDLRTHITEKRWNGAKNQLNVLLRKYNINSDFGIKHAPLKKHDSLKDVIGQYGNATISLDRDEILLHISTKNIQLELNLRRGMAIKNLAFSSHNMKPCIGTLPHGHFSCISLGADYYSGGVLIELPLQRKRITDLKKVEPFFLLKSNGDIEINAEIVTPLGHIKKIITILNDDESISLSYNFSNWKQLFGTVRLGGLTFLGEFNKENISVSSINGGVLYEQFILDKEARHTSPASTLVSSSGGLGATTGDIYFKSKQNKVHLKWSPSECAVFPMLQYVPSESESLSRVFFSMKELDDTSKKSNQIGSFKLTIRGDSDV